MLQSNEIQQRFNSIQQAIGTAAQTCQREADAPSELKDCIERLDRDASQASQVMQSNDENRIRQCVEDLEQLGDEAKRVCREQPQTAPQLKEAVMRVHDQLSDLKHQLH
jgi:phage shock protein A